MDLLWLTVCKNSGGNSLVNIKKLTIGSCDNKFVVAYLKKIKFPRHLSVVLYALQYVY